MKHLWVILFALAAGRTMAQEITPPRYQGADAQYFMSRLIGEAEKIIDAGQIPVSELAPRVAVGFTVDTAGVVTDWRFLDRTCEGRDKIDEDSVTPRMREVMTEALGRLEKWTPAQKDGRAVDYRWRLTMRFPVEKIARKQEADPLLFLGKNPDKSFFDWVFVRIRYDERFSSRGVSGVVHVQFWVEPDGNITIGEVLRSPDRKLSNEVIRVIRNSRGKWTPRKARGVPQRTEYILRINFT